MSLHRGNERKKEDLLGDVDFPEAEEEIAPPPPMMEEPTAVAMETGGVHVFVLPETVKVPADGEPHSFRLHHFKLDAEKKFFWNAVEFSEGIEVTTLENDDSLMLPGKARIYSQEDYIGETVLKLIAPREKVDIGTRFSNDLKVEKKLIEKSAEKAGLTRGKVAREYQYKLIIKNFRKESSPIKVMDRIPHSDSEIIKVELGKLSHKPTQNQLGVLTWELNVGPKAEEELIYSYQVEYPRDKTITPPLP